MERYFEGMKYVLTSLCFVFLAGCSRPQDDSDIIKKFIAAGGGDPATAKDFEIQAWFSQHQNVRREFEQPCAPLLAHHPNANWLTSPEGKICFAEGRAKPVEYKSDGSKF
jgi:hypothetical protein